MKNWICFLIALATLNAEAGARVSDRPSCEMLAWRWVNTISRMQERFEVIQALEQTGDYSTFKVLSERLPDGGPEGLNPLVQQKNTFQVSGAKPESVKIIEINTPAVHWKNLTENLTDLVVITVLNGKIEVNASISYGDFCFSPRTSEIRLEVAGRPVTLTWETRNLNLQKYMNLIKK